MAVGESYDLSCSSWFSRDSLKEQKTGEQLSASTEGVLLQEPVLPGFLFLQDCQEIQDFPALPVKKKVGFIFIFSFGVKLSAYIPLRHVGQQSCSFLVKFHCCIAVCSSLPSVRSLQVGQGDQVFQDVQHHPSDRDNHTISPLQETRLMDAV